MKKRDLFTPLVAKQKLNPNFLKINPNPDGTDHHEPTRRALQASFDCLPKPDGNFIKDFQTTGFDARVWELYLSETFRSVGLSIEQPNDRPDFLVRNRRGDEVWVEAVTANASQVSAPTAKSESSPWEELDDVAIKLGGPLSDKLKKKYWELPHVTGKSLVLAIADFHDPTFHLRSSVNTLERYAYGLEATLTSELGDSVTYTQEEIGVHVGRKTIPSGFFDLEGSENVSALLFSNAGTVAKFSRMGFREYPVPGMIIARFGFEYDEDPVAILPAYFSYFVDDEPEAWFEELVVLMNPKAKHPLPEMFFGPVATATCENKEIVFHTYGRFIYSSLTQKVLCPDSRKSLHKRLISLQLEERFQSIAKQRPTIEQEVIRAHRTRRLK